MYREETPASAHLWLYRAKSLQAAGIPLAAASDAPLVPPSPWVGLAAARSRRTASGAVLTASECLRASDAIALFTTGAARALGADALGRLVPGAPADVIVVEPDELAATRVRLTLVGGEVAWAG